MKTLTHAYKFYKAKYKKEFGRKISSKEYKDVCYAFNQKVSQGALDGKLMYLPFSMGSLRIKRKEVNYEKPAIDWKATKDEGKVLYHMNHHSDGWRAVWKWSKMNNLIANLVVYSFTASRDNKRAVAKIMKQKNEYRRYFT